MSSIKEESKKTRRYNSAQIAEMVDYMSTHSELASGRFSCAMGNVALDRQWEALSKILEEHGPKKTVAQWKTVWRDLKCKVRGRLAEVNRANRATGNQKSAPPLTEIEQKVIAIIGTVSSIGDPSTCERGLRMAESEEQPIGVGDISFPLPSEFEWVQHEMEVNIEPQAGPSVQMDPTPAFQAKDPAESPGNSLPSSSRKRKRHTDVEELESAVKLFKGIQQDHNSSIKEMANAINRLASAQEKLLVQQQTSATILETAVAAQLESNRLQQAHNIKISELFAAFLLDRDQ